MSNIEMQSLILMNKGFLTFYILSFMEKNSQYSGNTLQNR